VATITSTIEKPASARLALWEKLDFANAIHQN
jgi:hypothetical protein